MGITMMYFYYISRNYEYKTHKELVQLELEEEEESSTGGFAVHHPKHLESKESLTGGQDL